MILSGRFGGRKIGVYIMREIKNLTMDEERALYHLQDAVVRGCVFEGPADGESAMKEGRDLRVEDCRFALRYPLWHVQKFTLANSVMEATCRAPLWYSCDGIISDTAIRGVKCLRECDRIVLKNVSAQSPEFGWKCRDLTIENGDYTSEYFLLESKNITIRSLTLAGKYTFQYTENVTIEDSVLNTKDAFWHAKNVVVRDSIVNGEYLGWYSEGLTLINCKIKGTQPFCYCKDLKLVNCTMEETDLSFEYSDVEADVVGQILSVKNPRSGRIVADGYGEIISSESVFPLTCEILVRK